VGPEEQVPPGATIHVEADPSGWRLFDSSGTALPRPRSGAQEPVLPRL